MWKVPLHAKFRFLQKFLTLAKAGNMFAMTSK